MCQKVFFFCEVGRSTSLPCHGVHLLQVVSPYAIAYRASVAIRGLVGAKRAPRDPEVSRGLEALYGASHAPRILDVC